MSQTYKIYGVLQSFLVRDDNTGCIYFFYLELFSISGLNGPSAFLFLWPNVTKNTEAASSQALFMQGDLVAEVQDTKYLNFV